MKAKKKTYMEFDRETHFLIYLIGGVVLKAGQVLLRQWLAIMAEWWFASIRLNTRIRLREQGFLSQSRQLSQVCAKLRGYGPDNFKICKIYIVLKIINNHQHPTIILEIFTAAQQCYMIITSLDGYYILSHVQIVSAIWLFLRLYWFSL